MVRLTIACVVVAAVSIVAEQQKPPLAPERPVTDRYHGVAVADPYRWLDNWNDPEVRAWTEVQNRYTRAMLDAQPFASTVRERLRTLGTATSARWFALAYRTPLLFALKFQPPLNQPRLITMSASADPSTERVVLDPNRLDPTGATTIDFYVPSQHGRLVAVSLSTGGTEEGTVHVFATSSGEELPDTIPRVNGGTAGGSVAWNADDTGFFYTRYPRGAERPATDKDFYQQVYFHKLGTPSEADTYSLGKDFPRIAEIQLESSRDGRYLTAAVSNGDGGERAHYIRSASGPWRQIAGFADGVSSLVFGFDAAVYALTHKDAPHGAVIKMTPGAPGGVAGGRTIYRAPDGGLESITPTATQLYLNEVIGGPFELHAADLNGDNDHTIAVLPVSSVRQVVALDRDDVLFESETYLSAPAWSRISGRGTPAKTALASQSSVDFGDVVVARIEATSKDGTHVPLTVLRRRSLALDGNNPALLWGYGGFGASVSPVFNPTSAIWLEQGGVLAFANLRGGGEFGEEWHRAGQFTHKQNVFDDFIACARLLIDRRFTSSAKLAISGGSNGGLLMGAVLTERPDLARAVVSLVGIYDILRSELWANGAFNVTEFGSVNDSEQFKAMSAYSPYQHVTAGTPYPAVLLLSGTNDPRVNPGDSRRFAARLQAATSSDRPVLLRVSGTGHIGTGLSESLAAQADVYTFLFWQLGVNYASVK
jgi:prolyl oligopeptidase